MASIFWLDEELGSDIYLDGIVTVVDAKYGLEQLREKVNCNYVSLQQSYQINYLIIHKITHFWNSPLGTEILTTS